MQSTAMVEKTMVLPRTIQNPWLMVKPWSTIGSENQLTKHVNPVQVFRTAILFYTFLMYLVRLKLRITLV
jgi:hypothetical protein